MTKTNEKDIFAVHTVSDFYITSKNSMVLFGVSKSLLLTRLRIVRITHNLRFQSRSLLDFFREIEHGMESNVSSCDQVVDDRHL